MAQTSINHPNVKNREAVDAQRIASVLATVVPLLRERQQSRPQRLEASLRRLIHEMRLLRVERNQTATSRLKSLCSQIERAAQARQKREAIASPALNCWEILDLIDDEVSHSRVLAWLFDRRGSHAQGSLFLREWLAATAGREFLPETEAYYVATEVSHARSRIDIEVLGKTFVMHVECKINAQEGVDQTCREREDLKAKATARGIPSQRTLAFYLSATGEACSDTELFRPLPWARVVEVVDSCVNGPDIHPENAHLRWLLQKYVDVLRRYVVRST